MSDDFDRDDLDWLSDDGDDDESRRNDDDDLSLELDWLRDDNDDQPAKRDDRLGVTGELSWRDDDSGNDAPAQGGDDRRTGVTGQLSWLEDSVPDSDKSSRGDDERRTGVTGQLSWRGDSRESEFESQLEEAESAAGIDPSSFLESDSSAEDTGGNDALPEWMQGMDMPDLDDDEGEDDLYEDDLYEDDLYDEDDLYADPLPDDAPEWLSGTGGLGEQVNSDEAPSWLADTGSLGDAAENADEAPSWLADTGSIGNVAESADEAPSWLADTGSLGGMVEDTNDAPSWLSGTGSLDDDVPAAQEKSTGGLDIPDWLSGGGDGYESDDEYEAVDDDEDVQGVPDWLATGETGSPGTADLAPAADHDDARGVPEWLQGSDVYDDDEDEEEAYEFAEEADAGVPEWLSGGMQSAVSDASEADYYEDDDIETAVPDWLSEQQTGGDFNYQTIEEAQAEEAAIGNVDEFDSLFGEDDFALEDEDEFDLLGELTGDVGNVDSLLESTADEDDFDLLGELGVGESSGMTDMLTNMENAVAEDDDIFGDFGLDDDEADEEIATIFAKPDFGSGTADDDLDDLFGMDDDGADEYEDYEDDDAFTPAEAMPSGVMSDADLDSLFGMDDDAEQIPEGGETIFAKPDFATDAADDELDDLFGNFGDDEEEDAFAPSEAVPADSMFDTDPFGTFANDEEEDGAFTPAEAMPSGVMSDAELDSLFDVNDDYADDSDDDEDRFDWFGEEEASAAESGDPDWLSNVDASDAEAMPNDQSFLAELGIEPDADAPAGRQFRDVDDYLSTFGDNRSLALPQTGDLAELSGNVDFDDLFDSDIDDIGEEEKHATAEFERESNPDRPSWLDDVNVNVGGVSASTMIRGQKDASIEDLPDRLQALHERGKEMRGKQGEVTAGIKSILPEASEVLSDVDFGVTESAMIAPLNLSTEQRSQVNILRTLAGGSMSGVGVLLDDDEQPQRAARRRLLSGRVVERFFILLILALAVILPFVDGLSFLHVGELPPPAFEAGSGQIAFFNEVDSLNAGDIALIAAEYGPTSAAELDAGLQAMLIHMLGKGVYPVIVSGNPVGLLHAGNVLEDIAEDLALVENQDYTVGRYLVGDAIGVRAFTETIPSAVASDSQGRSTNLDIDSLDDFALIVIVADRSEGIRNWAEQVAPETTTPLMGITTFAVAPLAQPYLQAANGSFASGINDGITGLIVGYRDAYTYLTLLGVPQEDGQSALDAIIEETPVEVVPEITETPTIEPSPTFTATADVTEEVIATEEVTEDATEAIETEEVVVTPNTPTATRVTPTATTVTTQVTATPTTMSSPTQTATPANSPTPAVELIRFGTVNSTTSINVRSGPSTTSSVAAVLRPRDRVLIIDENDDASWYQVLLEDGTPGWVAAFLLDVEVEMVPVTPVATQSSGKRRVDGVPERLQGDDDADATAEVTDEAQATEEVQPTATEIPAEATEEAVAVDANNDDTDSDDENLLSLGFGNIDYRDERWYAMTLGLIASIVVIFVGTILNVLRALARRRRGE
ncbi:MAG: SH3 domain-containing protein [Aggregatilineales bacterium]